MATSKHIRGYEVATLPARLVRTFRSATTRRRGWAASSPLPLLSGRRLMLPGLSSKIHLWEVSDVYVLSIMQESVAKVMEDSFVLKGLSEYRRSGSNRHGALAPPDFESENPRPGASYYVLGCSVGMPKTWLLWSGVSFCIQPRSSVYCCHIAARRHDV